MERQQSFKLECKSSLEAEPRTMSKRDYEIDFAAFKAYMQGNIEVQSPASTQDEKAVAVAVQLREGKAAAATKPTKEGASSSGSGSGVKIPALA